MDRNSAIGLTLIAALLLVYFYWFSPKPQPQSTPPAVNETPKGAVQEGTDDEVVQSDSAVVSSFGDLSAFARGTEQETSVETEDLSIVFSSRGAILKEV